MVLIFESHSTEKNPPPAEETYEVDIIRYN